MRGHWHSGISEAGASGLAMGGERLKTAVGLEGDENTNKKKKRRRRGRRHIQILMI